MGTGYEIIISGHLPGNWVAFMEGIIIRCLPDGKTALSGKLDQPALFGILLWIRDLGLTLVSVEPVCGSGADAPSQVDIGG